MQGTDFITRLCASLTVYFLQNRYQGDPYKVERHHDRSIAIVSTMVPVDIRSFVSIILGLAFVSYQIIMLNNTNAVVCHLATVENKPGIE